MEEIKSLKRGIGVIRRIAEALPESPGVYRMLGEDGRVLYVGKAKNLKKRVLGYTKEEGHPYRILRMVSLTYDMEIVRTDSEAAAFLLENDLIKRLNPVYNVLLKDDKSFAHILIRQDHEYPQILKVRGAKKKGGKYFGPFTSAHFIDQTLTLLQKVFLLRSCSDGNFRNRSRPCLMYQIKRCCAPCVGYVSREEYKRLVQQATDFFDGKDNNLQLQLEQKMNEASTREDFEMAAVYRDRIKALNQIQLNSDNELQGMKSTDFIAFYEEGEETAIHVSFIRNEKNYGTFTFFQEQAGEDMMESFLGQLYGKYVPPKEIVISHNIPSEEMIAEALGVKIISAPRGIKKRILERTLVNAQDALHRRQILHKSWDEEFGRLEELIGHEPINKVEIYDNSHIQSAFALGVAVGANRRGFDKKAYRRFDIKTEKAAGDDSAMMKEVLERRIRRGISENNIPDLIIIDGGKGQLASAVAVRDALDVDVRFLAIAKGEKRNAGGETLYMPGKDPIILDKKDPLLYFLERLRDEAHRFAITSHRKKRSKGTIKSELDNINGVGEKRKKVLLQYFGSAKGVSEASLNELKKVPGFDGKIAKKVYEYFNN